LEVQLRRWVLEALAPASAGFDYLQDATWLQAQSDGIIVRLDWANMTLRYAEANFERRHRGATELMDRLAHTVPQAHSEAGFRRYSEDELGGRKLGSAVVGVARTKTVHQVYYAKYTDRLRAETRYTQAIRNAIRATGCSTDLPLTELLGQVRAHAAKEANKTWAAFCVMCAEPPRAMLHEVADMMAKIAKCAQAAKVDYAPVFASLLTSGGIDETPRGGPAPRRLMDLLERSGLIIRKNLNPRRRPGEVRRHSLTGDWLDIVNKMKAAFDEADDHTTNNA
jgi:hypothetical protein